MFLPSTLFRFLPALLVTGLLLMQHAPVGLLSSLASGSGTYCTHCNLLHRHDGDAPPQQHGPKHGHSHGAGAEGVSLCGCSRAGGSAFTLQVDRTIVEGSRVLRSTGHDEIFWRLAHRVIPSGLSSDIFRPPRLHV